MTLIVEDGSGIANAESYAAVAFADDYAARFGNVAWALADGATKESALRRATQYINTRYVFDGKPLTATQALAWPRTVAPWPVAAVQSATCELAARALDGALYTDQADAPVTEESVGPVTVKYGYSQHGGQTRFAIVDDLLRGLLAVAGRLSLRLERAE